MDCGFSSFSRLFAYLLVWKHPHSGIYIERRSNQIVRKRMTFIKLFCLELAKTNSHAMFSLVKILDFLQFHCLQSTFWFIKAYNGGLLLSRHRNDANMPANVREELRKTASSFGLNFDDMCSSDNSWCPESWHISFFTVYFIIKYRVNIIIIAVKI